MAVSAFRTTSLNSGLEEDLMHRKPTGSGTYRRNVFPDPPEALAFKEHKAEMEETFLVPSGF